MRRFCFLRREPHRHYSPTSSSRTCGPEVSSLGGRYGIAKNTAFLSCDVTNTCISSFHAEITVQTIGRNAALRGSCRTGRNLPLASTLALPPREIYAAVLTHKSGSGFACDFVARRATEIERDTHRQLCVETTCRIIRPANYQL
jgi:hypothetical protein